MLRRDYILRMIEEFSRALAKILQQKQKGEWKEAARTLEEQVEELTGTDLASVATLTDTELLDCLMKTGEVKGPGIKPLLLARLLLEASDPARPGQAVETARALRLRALHLLLYTAIREDVHDWPEFVPTVDTALRQFVPGELPLHTQGLLMQHFERTGQFARAEDALFAMSEQAPDSVALRQLGLSFYQRLLAKPNSVLESGELPREEVEAGLEEFRNMGV